MNYKLLTIFFFLIFSIFSCKSNKTTEPLIGAWEWSSGSRAILPSGFESRHKDKSPTYLIIEDGTLIYEFNEDGTFELNYTHPTAPASKASGFWTLKGEDLSLEILERENYDSGITQFKIPLNDNSNLDLQWAVQYLDFSDAQYEEWKNTGFDIPFIGTPERDSLLENAGTLITSFITIHYEKM